MSVLKRLQGCLLAGAEVEVNMETNVLTDLGSGQTYALKPLGEVGHHAA